MDDVMERLQQIVRAIEALPGRRAVSIKRPDIEIDVDAESLPLYGRPETVICNGMQWDRVRLTIGTVPIIICGPFRAAPKE